MKSILYGVTSDVSLVFYTGHAKALKAAGFETAFVTSPGAFSQQFAHSEGVTVFVVPMRRQPSIVSDLCAFLKLVGVIRKVRPDLTNFGTPKAGLLGNLAAFFCRVPHRIYTLHGLRLETATGWNRWMLALCEKIACACAHQVVCVSPSLRERAIELELVSPEKTIVPGSGTCNGIEIERFSPLPMNVARSEQIRKALSLSPGVPVLGFVGRLTRDKGICELFEAFLALRCQRQQLHLLLVGDFEASDPVPRTVRDAIEQHPAIIRTGFVADASPYYHLMDLVAVPTYREGFSLVSIEAQAAGIPVVITEATGIVDSILVGKSGLIVPVGDIPELINAIGSLLDDPLRRAAMGRAGQEWVSQEFAGDKVRAFVVNKYDRLLRGTRTTDACQAPQSGWQRAAKRGLDLIVLALSLPLFLPLLAIIALVIRVSMGAPILFRQQRPGRDARPFTLLKFRTMTDDRDANGNPLPDAQRLSRLGHFLRNTSLDELPELWNVVTGEMTLVGPRPLLMQYLERYTREQARRHLVRPGITGWAQINGRNAISWDEKFALDTWYVDHWNLILDFRILVATLWYVLRRENVSHAGHATMPEFSSNPGGCVARYKAGVLQ